jgi:hypothetical protein
MMSPHKIDAMPAIVSSSSTDQGGGKWRSGMARSQSAASVDKVRSGLVRGGSTALGTSFADQRRLIDVFISSRKYYAAEVAIAIGSTIKGSSFSGLLTRVEIGSVTSLRASRKPR